MIGIFCITSLAMILAFILFLRFGFPALMYFIRTSYNPVVRVSSWLMLVVLSPAGFLAGLYCLFQMFLILLNY